MATSLILDETGGVQNVGSGDGTGNDTTAPLPTEFDNILAVVAVGQGTPDGVALSGASTSNPDGVNMFTFGPNVTDVSFTDAFGAALDGDDSELVTSDGNKIFLYTYPGNNNVLLGRRGDDNGTPGDPTDDFADDTGAVVFAAFLDTGTVDPGDAGSTGAKVWLVQYEPLFHPDATDPDDAVSPDDIIYVSVAQQTSFSLEGAPSGQNLFLMFGDGTPTSTDVTIVVTGKDPADESAGESIVTAQTVNTGKGGGGTTLGNTNQMIDPLEGLVFSFVTGAVPGVTVPNLDQNEADVESNIDFTAYHPTDGARFTVVQLQPPKAASLQITAIDNENNIGAFEKGDEYINANGVLDADDDVVTIDSVTVTVVGKGKGSTPTAYTFTADGTQGDVTVAFQGDGSVKLFGVKAGYEISYHTGELHNRVVIDNIGNTDPNLASPFDIGGFSLASSTTTPTLFEGLAFEDDAPTADGNAVTDAVDEDGLAGGNPGGTGDLVVPADDGDTSEATTVGNISGIFDAGADGLKSYGLSTDAADIALLPALTSKGGTVLYDVTGGTLTAYVEAGGGAGFQSLSDRSVFTLSLNTSTGAYAFALLDQLDHATLDGLPGDDTENDLTLNLGSILQVTDRDDDTVTAAADKLVMTVDDDTPLALAPGDVTVANAVNATGSAALGYIGKVGADEPGSVQFVGTDGSLWQGMVQDGTPTLQNLTVNGSNVYLFGFGTDTLIGTLDPLDPTDTSDWAFRMTLQPDGSVAADDIYDITIYQPIANTIDVPFGSFTAKVSSGNPLTLVVENIGGSTIDALFSGWLDNGGTSQTTVNVSGAGVGVGVGQDFNHDAGTSDRIRIEFLEDDGDGVLEAGEATPVNRFTYVMNQNNSPADDGDLIVRIYDSAGNEIQIAGILVNGETLVGAGGAPVDSNDGTTVTALASGKGYEMHGLGGGTAGSSTDNDTVTIIGATSYARIDITGIGDDANKDTFDILLQSVAVPTPYDATFSVQANLTDEDGDSTAASNLDVTLDADGLFLTLLGVVDPLPV